ncbi:MAG: hypothetical protein KatS3mg105_2648 [Gemmatales bacterium]|nr:MAG: hypothetical protein KatS3mg105_2648 [Gemmatales bacterium]
MRWNLFQLIQAAGRADRMGIPAKGLTGQAYEGQYFWDMDMYVLPFLTYTSPRLARNLLMFRYNMLDHARQRARTVSQKGALFPWRTINGEEASAYYAASTAQYHINAAIAFGLRRYVQVTGGSRVPFRVRGGNPGRNGQAMVRSRLLFRPQGRAILHSRRDGTR